MKTNPSTVYRWVVAAMNRITAEPARLVLELELRRLDDLQSGIYVDAVEGDPVSIRLYLDIRDRRAKLLGLYPKEPQVHFNIPGTDQPELIRIEFVLPDKPPPASVGVTPPQPTGYAADAPADYSKPALPAPPERIKTEFGIVEHRGPTYQDQMGGSDPPSAFDRGGPRDWMK